MQVIFTFWIRIILPAALLGIVLGLIGWLFFNAWSADAATAKIDVRPAGRGSKGAPTRYDRLFGNVYYKVPAGYLASQKPGGIIMLRRADVAAGDANGLMRIEPGVVLDAKRKADLKADKNLAIKRYLVHILNMDYDDTDDEAKVSEPQLVNDPAKDGYAVYLVQTRFIIGYNGLLRLTQCAVVLTGDRVEVISRTGLGSQANFDDYEIGFKALLASLAFKNAGAPPPHAAKPLPSVILQEDAGR